MLKRVMVGMIVFYQRWISVATPASCRFQPTCSEYAKRAIETHGPIRGSWMATKRIGRCHPWGGFGYDPVPEHESLPR